MPSDTNHTPERKQKKLAERLKKAEEALSAIQKGEVDAVVVKSAQGEKVYSLHDTRVSNLLESITDGFISLDREWRYVYVNKKAEQLFNRTSADMLGRVHWDLYPDTGESPVPEKLRKAMKERISLEYEIFSPQVNRWMHMRVYPSPEGIAVFFVDITERKETEQALQYQNDLRELITENAMLGIYMIDERGVCTYMNPSAEKITGFTYEDVFLAGKPLHDIIHHTRLDGTPYKIEECSINKAIMDGSQAQGEEVFIHKDGTFYSVAYTASPIFKDGVWTGTIIEIRDTSKEKEAEARRQELERQKDEFIGIASHELKTPLTSVKAYTQVLKYKFEKAGDRESAKQLGKMDAQLNKLTHLVGDLLDVTKIEAGKLQLDITRFDFDALVREVVDAMQLTTERHEVVTKLNAKKSVYGDRDRVGQVITNLISNAIKYSPRGGKIQITTSSNKEHVQAAVKDFGVGIAKKSQSKLFERFYRVRGPHQHTFPGLGLGLYISAEIVERLKGRIWVESAKGKGSTFYVRLPVSKKHTHG